MNYLKHMKQKFKSTFWWIFIGFCIGITPYMFIIADLERGYNSTGGEIFIIFMPLFIWLIKDAIKEIKTIWKGELQDD